jgi:hypothetical protein
MKRDDDDTPHPRHRVREITAPQGLAYGGMLVCECGWYKRFTRLGAALSAHHRHGIIVRFLELMLPAHGGAN